MAGKAARPKPAAALRQAVGDVKDLAGELGALAEGIAVTEAAREVVPLAPPPKGQRRDLGRLRPQGPGSRTPRPAPAAAASTAAGAAPPAPQARAAAPAPARPTTPAAAPATSAAVPPPAPRARAAPAPASLAKAPAKAPAAAAQPALPAVPPARELTAGAGASSPMPAALAGALPNDIFTPPRPAPLAHVELVDDVDPTGRPWTLAAAMEPIEGPATDSAYSGAVTEGERHPWLMTAVVVGAVLVAILVFVGSHLNLGSTPTVGFAVNGLRALHAQDDTTVTQDGHFASTAASILIEADYIGATKNDTLTVTVERDGSPLTDKSVTLDAVDGTATATLQSAGTSFAPGNYVVTAVWHKQTLRTIAFVVDPPATPASSPAPLPTPSSGAPTPPPAGPATPQPSP